MPANYKRGMIVRLLGLGLLGSLASTAAQAQADALPKALVEARFYAWGMVGTPGAMSDEERAARTVFRMWSHQEMLRALPTANPEGKLYLLCVVRRRFPDRYAEAKALAGLAPDQQVSVFSGSVLRKVPASDLIGQFERSACEPLSWPQDPAPKGG